MGASGEEARRCAELISHVSKVKAWEQRDGCVIGMESASNSAPQAPIDPTGAIHYCVFGGNQKACQHGISAAGSAPSRHCDPKGY
jgi:hypothetical protein